MTCVPIGIPLIEFRRAGYGLVHVPRAIPKSSNGVYIWLACNCSSSGTTLRMVTRELRMYATLERGFRYVETQRHSTSHARIPLSLGRAFDMAELATDRRWLDR